MPQDMRTDNAIDLSVDQYFRPSGGLGVSALREPLVHVIDRDAQLHSLFLGGGLCQTDARECRHREDARRNTGIIGYILGAIDDVPADGPPFIGT